MRKSVLAAIAALALAIPAIALAKTITVSSGGVTAALSYKGGPGITTKNLHLKITKGTKIEYSAAVKSKFCLGSCSPVTSKPVHVSDLYADGGREVVLGLFTNGADCCEIAQVFTPSASIGSYVFEAQRNFDEAGFALKNIGPKGRPEFVSADGAFYCQFTACYASGLPLQIFEFANGGFRNVTRAHPRLIKKDAHSWWKIYSHSSRSTRDGALAAWAADEDLVNRCDSTVNSSLTTQVHKHKISQHFATRLERFLVKHGYAGMVCITGIPTPAAAG
jgi:hypothetical protein